MATTGTVNGRIIVIKTGNSPGTTITCLTDSTLSLTADTRDTSCKDSTGNWSEAIVGTQSWTISGSGKFAFDASHGFEDLYDLYLAGAAFRTDIASTAAGDLGWYGNALCTDLSLNAPDNEDTTFDFTFTGTGALNKYTTS
jgi:predicted secreted protein